MGECWTLFLDASYVAAPWPWPDQDFETLTSDAVETLPFDVNDFTRYSPSDGPVDMAQVPVDMPREVPACETRMAVYHDAEALFVFVAALPPAASIPELSHLVNEDFSLVVQLDGPARGLYFGLNQLGEHMGCVQVWDPDVQGAAGVEAWPWCLMQSEPGKGPSNWDAGMLRDGYAARVLEREGQLGLTACWRLNRSLVQSGIADGALRLTVGRRCHATAELVSWGSSVVWSPRMDRMGTVQLAAARAEPSWPRVRRIDMDYDPSTETGALSAQWTETGPGCDAAANGPYAKYLGKATFAVNGIEDTVAIGGQPSAHFALTDGWNRVEVLTGVAEPVVVDVPKTSGNRILSPRFSSPVPDRVTLRRAFEDWHQEAERQRVAPGTWGDAGNDLHCLCHEGAFWALPYLLACRHLERRDVYIDRLVETCERMIEAQHAEGWFPCHCSATGGSGSPGRFEGGAFANGSVGELLAAAGAYLGEDRYLLAARRAADAYLWYEYEHNQNYAAFALWHLAELYAIDGDDSRMERGIYYARHFVCRDIGLSGAQDGHNYYTAYGNITLKGMARLLAVLPAGHPFGPWLQDKVIRFTNQILWRQQPSGLFAGRNRKYLGYHHLVPGLIDVALALPAERGAVTPALGAMASAALDPAAQDSRHVSGPDRGVTLAGMARLMGENGEEAGGRQSIKELNRPRPQ